MTIGEKIKQIRLKKGMTQKQLGEKCGLADSAVRRYELGKANPKQKTIEKIAIGLGVPVSKLLNIREYDVTKELLIEHPELREKITTIILEEVQYLDEFDFENQLKNASIDEFVKLLKAIVTSIELDDNFNVRYVNMSIMCRRSTLLDAFDKLTPNGQVEAISRVQELTEVPKYRNNKVDEELEKFSNMFE